MLFYLIFLNFYFYVNNKKNKMDSIKNSYSSYSQSQSQNYIVEDGKIPKIKINNLNDKNIEHSQTKNLNSSSLRQGEEEEYEDENNNNRILNKNMKALSSFKRGLLKTMDENILFEKITNFQSYSKKVKVLDFLIGFINFASVCFFYNDHFEYIDNGLKLSKVQNIIRIFFIFVSIFTVILLHCRYKLKYKSNKILVELDSKSETCIGPKAMSLEKKKKFIEMFIHILQPYPYLKWEFEIEILGNPIIYSLNMILYFLSTIRLYYIIKIIKTWNLFSTPRSKKILSYFESKGNPNFFLIKANLDDRGFLTLSFIGLCALIYFSLLLKVLEYFEYDKSNPFNYVINNFWYLLITMGTIGYGDITPKTVLGRIIGVIVCLVGVVVLSLIVVTLTIFTYLDSDELVAYNSIKNLGTSESKKKKIDEYIKKIIVTRVKYKFKRVDLDCIIDKYQRNLQKTECNIQLHKQKETKNVQQEFVKNLNETADKHIPSIIQGLQGIWDLEDNLEDYFSTNDSLFNISKESKNIMISCLNLGKCLAMVGGLKNIKKITEISHKKAVSTLDLQKAKQKFSNINGNVINNNKDIEKEKESEVNSKFTGSSTNNNIKNFNENHYNDIIFENNAVKKEKSNDNDDCINNNKNNNNDNNDYSSNDDNSKNNNQIQNYNDSDSNYNNGNNNNNDSKNISSENLKDSSSVSFD